MKLLVYGAGVLGTLYAARLQDSGNNVSILARGERLNGIRANGLVLEDILTNRKTITHVNVVERLAPVDSYDFIIVLMRKNQVSAILPTLAANSNTRNIIFMHNNAAGFGETIESVSRERVLVGFPGAGGTLEGNIVHYGLIPQQRTMLGELDGRITPRVQQIAATFREAGFPVSISRKIDAWLKTHVAFVTSIAGALYLAGGNNYRLAKMPDGVPTMVRAVREGFKVIRAHHLSVTPFKLAVLFEWLPFAVPIVYWRRYFNTPIGDYFFARHALAAGDEMKQLADEFRMLISQTSVATPSLNQLYRCIDEYAAV
jgi:2-dehydropantoate 2-reductase